MGAFVDALWAGIRDTGTPGALVSDLGSLGLTSQAREPWGMGLRCRDPRAWVLAARTLQAESQMWGLEFQTWGTPRT